MKLVIGLGNPGRCYEATKHNVGFITADLISEELDVSFTGKFKNSIAAETHYKSEKIILAKPQSFMNRSGTAVLELLNYFKAEPQDLIIIHDDLDMDLGQLRIRKRGSHGGHKGIGSIINYTGTKEFIRVKIGIGRPPENIDPADYVLKPFGKAEWTKMKETLTQAKEAVFTVIDCGVDKAMNKYNVSKKTEKE